MSIAIMKKGDVMGRGASEGWKLDAAVRARLRTTGGYGTAVAILGAGPAGLLAAHAVALAGGKPAIFSKPDSGGVAVKSEIGPATYLHKAIPDLTSAAPDAMLTFVKKGTGSGYALKVYGSRYHPCSWDKFEAGEAPAWALQPAYDDLWDRYGELIIPMEVDPETVRMLLDDFGAVVSTVPAPALCEADHAFPFRKVWISDHFTFHDDRDPIMVYDGQVGGIGNRFRASRIFGKACTEYASPVPEAREGIKVLATNCDCHPEIVRAGRWGTWTPGVLVHHAFEKVWAMMFDNFEGR